MYIACAPASRPLQRRTLLCAHVCVCVTPARRSGTVRQAADSPTHAHVGHRTEDFAHRVEGEEGGREVLVTSGERRGRQGRRAEERAAGTWGGRRGWQRSSQLHVQGVWLLRRGLLLWRARRQRTRRRHRQAQQQNGGHPDARRRRRNFEQVESGDKMTGSRMGFASRDQLP